jgi:predicted TIM-barrel fold metal-dependent hydrolase
MPRKYVGGTLPDYYIVDSDSHVDESKCELWKRFPDELKPWAPRKFVDPNWKDVAGQARSGGQQKNSTRHYDNIWILEHSKVFPNSDFRTGPYGKLATFATHDPDQWYNREGERNPKERIKDLDAEGFDVTFIFCVLHQNLLNTIDNPEVAYWFARGWNDWVTEWTEGYRDRIRGTMILPLHDTKLALKELHRAADLGLGGAYLPCQFKGEWLYKERFHPILEECVKLGMPVSIHQQLHESVGMRRLDTEFLKHLFMGIDAPFSVCGFIASGVLDKFPDLKVAWIEQGAGWLPYYLERLEEHYEIMPDGAPKLRKDEPKDYFGDQLFICFEPEEADFLPLLTKKVGEDGIIIGSDYSHFDCLSPWSVQKVLERDDLTDSQKKKILSDNGIRFWNLDPKTHQRMQPREASRAS